MYLEYYIPYKQFQNLEKQLDNIVWCPFYEDM